MQACARKIIPYYYCFVLGSGDGNIGLAAGMSKSKGSDGTTVGGEGQHRCVCCCVSVQRSRKGEQ